MKHILVLFFSITLLTFTSTSHASVSADAPSKLVKGTYGSSMVNLTINEDHTFSYSDLSDKSNQLNVTGPWKLKNGKIVLTSSSDVKFHSKWKVQSDSQSIKSRKGLAFYRLCKNN